MLVTSVTVQYSPVQSSCLLLSGAEALARGCRNLKSFISKGCLQINDNAVSCLARNCPDLEVINLHGCTVSISWVKYIQIFSG
jgi:hypothetical protein